MERSYKTLFKLFLFLQKQFILDAWLGPEYAPDLFSSRIVLIYLHLWNKTLLGFYIHKYCKVFWGGMTDLGNFGSFIRWSAMKINFQM